MCSLGFAATVSRHVPLARQESLALPTAPTYRIYLPQVEAGMLTVGSRIS